jgi:hypothetical protein
MNASPNLKLCSGRSKPSSFRSAFLGSALGVALFSFAARAVLPPPTPDGGYAGENTAEGENALISVNIGTTTGVRNTAIGFHALTSDNSGHDNTATGHNALSSNTSGISNTADGVSALAHNDIGEDNTATGISALEQNTGGSFNTATGASALNENTSGSDNTADGLNALFFNTTGHDNTAVGVNALLNNNGSNNVAIGVKAGSNLTNGSNNIHIGANVLGIQGEANKIRIGKQGTQNGTFIAGIAGVSVAGSPVVVNSNGKLGVGSTSSARFKEAVKPMDKTSEAILALKPVTFRYKEEIDPDGIPQFGLVAEEVEKVEPQLVTRDEEGKPVTVRYDAVNAMLLNEFLKEHRRMQGVEKDLRATIAQQKKQIEALTAGLQKVKARLESSQTAARLASDE